MKAFLLSILCLFLAQNPLLAAFDAYLKLSENGKAVETDAVHSWIKVLGFEQGIGNTVNIGSVSGGGGSGASYGKPVILKLAPDGAVTNMMDGTARGTVFDLSLHFVKRIDSRSLVFVGLEFESVLVSSVTISGSDGDGHPRVEIEFSYGKLTFSQSHIDQKSGRVDKTLASTADFISNTFTGTRTVSPIQPGDYSDKTTPPPPPSTDNDDDGMPNAWEDLYSFNKDSDLDAPLDADKDGYTNLQEYIAGTHPHSPTSFFKVSVTSNAAEPGAPEVRLSWSAITGRTYRVLSSSQPSSGFNAIHTVTAGSNGSLTHTPAAGSGPFFRVQVVE